MECKGGELAFFRLAENAYPGMDFIFSDRDRVLLVGRSDQLGDWSYAK